MNEASHLYANLPRKFSTPYNKNAKVFRRTGADFEIPLHLIIRPPNFRTYIRVRIIFRVKILGLTNLYALSHIGCENEGVCTIHFNNALSGESSVIWITKLETRIFTFTQMVASVI